MKSKIKIIDEIVKRHPAYGVEKGWSEYVGGMKDSGQWFFRKMLGVPANELQEFLNEIIVEENSPKQILTPEQERDSKIIIPTAKGGWATKLYLDQARELRMECERKFLFGS